MIEYTRKYDYNIKKKQVFYIISRQCRFSPKSNKKIIDDLRDITVLSIYNELLKYKLLERVNRDNLRVINIQLGESIDRSLISEIVDSRGLDESPVEVKGSNPLVIPTPMVKTMAKKVISRYL